MRRRTQRAGPDCSGRQTCLENLKDEHCTVRVEVTPGKAIVAVVHYAGGRLSDDPRLPTLALRLAGGGRSRVWDGQVNSPHVIVNRESS